MKVWNRHLETLSVPLVQKHSPCTVILYTWTFILLNAFHKSVSVDTYSSFLSSCNQETVLSA